MNVRNIVAAATLVATFATTALAASAQQATLYAGAILYGQLNQSLNTGSAHVGDPFSLTVVPPYPNGDPGFQGATISGVVAKVQSAGQGRNPEIVIVPKYIRMYDGTVVNIHGNVTSIAAQKSTGGTAAKAAIGALAGMLVGNAIGKTVFHTNAGGAIGLIGGAMYGANNKTNFDVPQGAGATVQLDQTVTIRRQASHQ
jgi:hypothetical protein